MQCTQNILLIKPSSFAYNEETALSNTFQQQISLTNETIQRKITEEFDAVVKTLRSKAVDVLVMEDTKLPAKPDAVFPNNWASYHEDGTIILYPMYAPNRRPEKRPEIINTLQKHFVVTNIIDLSEYELTNQFLEGTGSIVFDHVNKIAYACLSPRTDKELFQQVAEQLNYKPISFYAYNSGGIEIYHTNVMMCIAEKFAVICLNSIADKKEKEWVSQSLMQTGHVIIDISFEQMNRFAGNMLALKSNTNKNLLAMSQSAFDCLTQGQKFIIEEYCEMVPLLIPTIESIGGGSARCMITEIFLPPLK